MVGIDSERAVRPLDALVKEMPATGHPGHAAHCIPVTRIELQRVFVRQLGVVVILQVRGIAHDLRERVSQIHPGNGRSWLGAGFGERRGQNLIGIGISARRRQGREHLLGR